MPKEVLAATSSPFSPTAEGLHVLPEKAVLGFGKTFASAVALVGQEGPRKSLQDSDMNEGEID